MCEKSADSDYRIKKESKPELMTNRQLAELLANGYGQAKYTGSYLWTTWDYNTDYEDDYGDDAAVDCDVEIRKWGEDEWRMATKDIFEKFMDKNGGRK